MTTLLLIRHGENDLILQHKLAGRLPGVHLNVRGRQQADVLAELLKNAPICAIYSSPLERAQETAAPLAQVLGLEVQTRPGLVELDYGRWQGRSFKQLARIRLWQEVKTNPAGVRFPGGESLVEVQARAAAEIETLAARHTDEQLIACFTHGDIIRLAIAHYLDMPLNSFRKLAVDTCSTTVLVMAQGRITLPHINQLAGFEIQLPDLKSSPQKAK
jgi:probable phosphomutase (TIGR03848 family)